MKDTFRRLLNMTGSHPSTAQEKQKAKVQERLNKCNKKKLFEFCDLLDIPVAKHTAKKEDVIVKLVDFFLLPCATTCNLLAEKEQLSNGKKSTSSGATPSNNSSKKQKINSVFEENKGTPELEDSEEEEENTEDATVSDGIDTSEGEKHVSEPESGEESKKRKRSSEKSPSKKDSASKTKSKNKETAKMNPQKKTPIELSTSPSKPMDQSETTPRTFSLKKKYPVVDAKPSSPKKSASKEKMGLNNFSLFILI
uniref:NKAP family protein CG6066-like n=1 Tax=Erigeron canadensis TaxID=72917 RepID=UPI001CB896EC|nr:NKAP family protein CG6066-like [Erigeron canadensis]